jgi:hypothetical protein
MIQTYIQVQKLCEKIKKLILMKKNISFNYSLNWPSI